MNEKQKQTTFLSRKNKPCTSVGWDWWTSVPAVDYDMMFIPNEKIRDTFFLQEIIMINDVFMMSFALFSPTGVAVGAGWQSVVAYVNLLCYYVVGIPIGVVLGYLIDLKVEGIWIDMLLGIAVQTLVLVYLTWRTDWDRQVAFASVRVNRWFVPSSEETNS